MYKKFMLHVLLLTFFSSSESLYSSNNPNEPIRQLINFVIAKVMENSSYIFGPIKDNSTNIPEVSTQLSEDNSIQKNPIEKNNNDPTNAVINGVVYVGSIVILQTGNVIYSWIFPTKLDPAHAAEADVRIKEAQERSAFLDAKANFSKCLKSIKKDAERNAIGIPTVCETKARDLILCDGEAAVILMMKNFNK